MERLRVMAVDDEPAALRLMDEVLAAEGYDVVNASGPRDAQRLLRERRIDAAVVALRAGRAGRWLREAMRRHPTVDVLVAAPLAELAAALVGLEVTSSDHVGKPINADELRHRMRRLFDRRRLREEVRLLRARLNESDGTPPPSRTGERLPTLAEAERALIDRALRVHANSRRAAARALGISTRTLFRRLEAYRRRG